MINNPNGTVGWGLSRNEWGRKDVANVLGAEIGLRGGEEGFFYGIGERRMRDFILMVFRASTGL